MFQSVGLVGPDVLVIDSCLAFLNESWSYGSGVYNRSLNESVFNSLCNYTSQDSWLFCSCHCGDNLFESDCVMDIPCVVIEPSDSCQSHQVKRSEGCSRWWWFSLKRLIDIIALMSLSWGEMQDLNKYSKRYNAPHSCNWQIVLLIYSLKKRNLVKEKKLSVNWKIIKIL